LQCSDCQPAGTEYCTYENNAFACKCRTGYSGKKCEIYGVTTTASTALKCSDCVTAGTQYCAFENNAFACKCKPGYQGIKCESFIVSTTPVTTPATVTKCSDCDTIGTSFCSVNNGVFSCTCKDGFEGATCNVYYGTTPTPTTLTTEKAKDCTYCSEEGTRMCVTDATHIVWCQCKVGYHGLKCENKVTVGSTTSQPATTQPATTASNLSPTSCTQCAQPGTQTCSTVAGCVGTNCPVACTCKSGWKGSTCGVDVNECVEGRNDGPNPVGICNSVPGWTNRCENLAGSYRCVCNPGIKGDTCTLDKNECIEDKPCIADNTVNCYNLWGSYTCICKEGYNGKNCDKQASAGLSGVKTRAAGWLLSLL